MAKAKIEKVIGYALNDGIMISLYGGWQEVYYINPRDIKAGGENCEYSDLCAECEIEFDYGRMGSLKNVTITYNPHQYDARRLKDEIRLF